MAAVRISSGYRDHLGSLLRYHGREIMETVAMEVEGDKKVSFWRCIFEGTTDRICE